MTNGGPTFARTRERMNFGETAFDQPEVEPEVGTMAELGNVGRFQEAINSDIGGIRGRGGRETQNDINTVLSGDFLPAGVNVTFSGGTSARELLADRSIAPTRNVPLLAKDRLKYLIPKNVKLELSESQKLQLHYDKVSGETVQMAISVDPADDDYDDGSCNNESEPIFEHSEPDVEGEASADIKQRTK